MKRHILSAASVFLAVLLTLLGKSSGAAGDGRSPRLAGDPAPAAKQIAVQAFGRGNPYINFEDGVELAASYEGVGEMQSSLLQDSAEARALASADFDEDGVLDLIVGYARESGGIVTLHRGNAESIHQNGLEAQRRNADSAFSDSAFLSPARVFEVSIAPDFVGAGDFDGDGHWDVVIGARGGNELRLLPGDGKGSFLTARKIELPGVLASLVTGEINRADGLTDVVAGVAAEDGPKALVFEGPGGALKAAPEVFSLPGEPAALALARCDDDYAMDLAVGAGSELVIIHGRDRKLSLDNARRAEVPPARIDRRAFGFEIRAIAAGDFTGTNETSLALLASDGTVQLASARKQSANKKAATKKGGDAPDGEVFGQWPGATQLVCARVSTGPADDLLILNQGGNSLQIQKTGLASSSRSTPSSSVRVSTSLDFDRKPVAVLSMRLNGDALNDLVVLQSAASSPIILKTVAAQTFTVTTADDHNDGVCDGADCTLREAINAANSNAGADTIAFNIAGAGAHTITPTSNLPAITEAVTLNGYTQPGSSVNTLQNGDNAVLRIELNGSLAGGSANGLTITGGSSLVKGLAINRFTRTSIGPGNGILVNTNGNNVIQGNFIGTNITGTTDQGNAASGVFIENTPSNTIGGTIASARNVISGNDVGGGVTLSDIFGAANMVLGNFIGTDHTGTAGIGNNFGVLVSFSPAGNIIGGSLAGARNVLSDSAVGIVIRESGGNTVEGNFIGTDVTGNAALGNFTGVDMEGNQNNTIGGTVAGQGNVISASVIGIAQFGPGPGGNLFQGNRIGTNAAGNAALGNTTGVSVNGSITFGGAAAGAGNVVSFSADDGVVAQAGNSLIMNNTISLNGRYGVWVQGGKATISQNSIFGNANLGINLDSDGVTPNDGCDADSGPNNRQNFPVLTSATSTTVQGTLNSAPSTTFTIEFFANTGCNLLGFGEGRTFVGSTMVTTATDCGASFNATLTIGVPAGQIITATATDPAGNTSEFSQCLQAPPPPPTTIGVYLPSAQKFFLRNSNSPGFADLIIQYGPSGVTPVVGDWDGNGTTTIGVYDPANQTFYLRNSNTAGSADITFQYGPPGSIPIAGDWDGNGTTTIGVYEPSSRRFFLRNSNSAGFADLTIAYGPSGATPVVGDWDGNGTTTIGVYDPATQRFFLRNSNTVGFADLTIPFGPAGATPVAGDWDGNGTQTIGVYDPASQTFYLRNNNTAGFADLTIMYGPSGAVPVVGDWNGS